MEFLPYADGANVEHFDQFASASKEDMLRYWKMGAEAAKDGKIVLYKGWPDHDCNFTVPAFTKQSQKEKEAFARSRITYPLACFLIGARENSYFCYGWGYDLNDGQLIDYPQYGYKLGEPKGEATREKDTWIFRRDFQHAQVMVDLEKREADIQWLE